MWMSDVITMETGGSYFAAPYPDLELFSSGCTLLDCVIGGGYPLGRIVNLVGDKSTGKTLLAMEAAANFHVTYPNGKIIYVESESAFDRGYAQALGMPVDSTEFVSEVFTVEDFFENLTATLDALDKNTKALYILDSLDALSDRAELERGISDGSYGAAKAKKTSELFRRLVQRLETRSVCLVIISQVRDNIGISFGKQTKRSGGRALDFYASQVVWLSQIGKTEKQSKGVKRTVGVSIRAKCEKNKIGLPYRSCDFPIRFGYGICDEEASLSWLGQVKGLDVLGLTSDADVKKFLKDLEALPDEEWRVAVEGISDAVKKKWSEVEEGFLPTRKKY